MKISIEHRWNDNDRIKQKCTEKTLSGTLSAINLTWTLNGSKAALEDGI